MSKIHAIVTVGLGFGDESKGATVDFLARHHDAKLVVRYSGGAQAGHNVQLPDGRRHTFSQFGAGTFAGATTFLGPRVIINPGTLGPEADHLAQLGIENPRSMLMVHPNCLIATVYHVAMNRMREFSRGAQRHGSCGLGIGETRHFWLQYGGDAITASDLNHRGRLIEKLTLLQDRMLLESKSMDKQDAKLGEILYLTSPQQEADLLIDSMKEIVVSPEMPAAKVTVFEGSQGVLLDEYFGFHPHTTWSTVTTKHAMELIDEAGIDTDETLGLTRVYTTRHGAGPIPTRCESLTRRINDLGNPYNDWQGQIQSGPLDLVLLRYAVAANPIDGLVVSHWDDLEPTASVCRGYEQIENLKIPRSLSDQKRLTEQLSEVTPIIDPIGPSALKKELATIAPLRILSDGPCFTDRRYLQP